MSTYEDKNEHQQFLDSLHGELRDAVAVDSGRIDDLVNDPAALKAVIANHMAILDKMSRCMMAEAHNQYNAHRHYQTALRAQNQFRASLLALQKIQKEERREEKRRIHTREKAQRDMMHEAYREFTFHDDE